MIWFSFGNKASIAALLTIVSATYADVSHLRDDGYHYPNLGATALHTKQSPPPTQYQATYGDNLLSSNNLPTSYFPPASGKETKIATYHSP